MNQYLYEEIQIGQKEEFKVLLTDEKVEAFRMITGDFNPLHMDSEYAKTRGYEDKVVYGMLTASFLSTFVGMYLPGKYSLIHSIDIKFPKPVYVRENSYLRIKGEVTDKKDMFNLLILKITVVDELGNKVCRGAMKVGVLDE